jgi:hypothetical protein
VSHPQLSMPVQGMALPEAARGVAVQAVPEASMTATSERRTTRRRPVVLLLFAVSVIALLIGGWLLRDADYTVADQGLGYALGIIGGVMMLLLLLYPVRKQAHFMRNWGALRYWFRMHMLLGVLGPVAILFHCNFHLGATNSNVALFSMLIVAGSGLIGRYVYTKIHFGLYGSRATLEDLQARSGSIEGDVQGALSQVPGVVQQLQTFHHIAMRPYSGVLSGLRTLLILGFAARRARHRAVSALTRWMKQQAKAQGWETRIYRQRLAHQRQLVESYISCLRQVAEFSAYERLFALWHVLHIPLFFMLVLAGIVHVFAVHIY